MKIKNSTKIRAVSSIWIIILLILSPIWWIVCVAEWFLKKKNMKHVKKMKDVKTGYLEITIDAYITIFKELKNSFKELRHGRKYWI